MTTKFFPGCKIKAKYPKASAKFAKTVIEREYADEVEGCCRTNHQKLTSDDTAVALCVNCMAMMDEDAHMGQLVNIYQLIDADPEFEFYDYGGIEMGLQDCGRSWDRSDLQDAIRSLMKKMNIKVVELADAREKSIFCGAFGLHAIPKQDGGFAPKRYLEQGPARGIFVEHSDEEIDALLKEHAAAIPTDVVACYCTGCAAGLEAAGKHAVNVIELIMGTADL